jgi:glycosyltransferase involved in cell wall biosynthesis
VRVERLVVDASAPSPDVPFGSADEWRVLLTHAGVPLAQFVLPDPGPTDDAVALLDRLVLRYAHAAVAQERLRSALRERLGAGEAPRAELSVSVVVCTRRRSRYLPDVLGAIAGLVPAPDEVIVVDNDPGDQDSRAVVEAAGARYVREDRRGLDNARNAGLRVAGGDLVAFTDDDCVPVPWWLRRLPELFANPRVGAVTGPAFAYSFTHPAQRRFEDSGGFSRGFDARRFDWTAVAPARASQAGAGANLIVRRAAVESIGEVFPPELDAGTATESGGDMYALYELLHAGWRVLYDPGTHVYHQHRESWDAMHRAFRGYGIGLSATLTKLLLRHRDPGTIPAWVWLARQYGQTLARRLAGSADALDVRIAWDYLSGGFQGTLAWRRALREAGNADGHLERRPAAVRAEAAIPAAGATVSVVIPTAGRPDVLARCLDALARQTLAPHETIVVDDRGGASVPDGVVLVRGAGAGAGAARNLGAARATGDLVLFMDDDLLAASDLVARHAAAHAAQPGGVVIGRAAPRPVEGNLVSRGARDWWEDHYVATEAAIAPTFADMLSGNMSIARSAFEDLGGFDERFGRLRREDWEFGVRVLGAGMGIRYEPRAVADHEFQLTTTSALDATEREGEGDALLAALHPVAVPSLRRLGPLSAARRVAGLLPMLPLLDTLERVGAVRTWWRLFGVARDLRYQAGRARGSTVTAPDAGVPRIDLASDAPIPPPAVGAPDVEVVHEGRTVARLTPADGRWTRDLADQIVDALPWPVLIDLIPPRDSSVPSGPSVTTITWPASTDAIAAAPTPLVAIVLASEPPPGDWAADAVALLGGARIDAVVGAGAGPGEPPPPAFLRTRGTERRPYRPLGQPPRYAVVRRDRFAAVGGFGDDAARLGPHAAVAELVERLLESGGTVAGLDLPAFDRPPSRAVRARIEIAHARARGGLIWQRAAGHGAAGMAQVARTDIVPLVARTVRGPGNAGRAYAAVQLAALVSAAPSARRRRG